MKGTLGFGWIWIASGLAVAAPDANWGLPTVFATPDGGLSETAEPSRPRLKVEKMPFSQESIREVVAYHQDEIQGCYEKTLADKERPIEGKLMTSFVITREGTVKGAKVLKKGTTLKEPLLHECVVEIL